MLKDLPWVSIIIPCRNEEDYIHACLESIFANDYPHDRMEVLIVDGMSEDNTRPIVQKWARERVNLHLLDNPKKEKSAALNLGIKHAKGEVIARADAHAYYPTNYFRLCVSHLITYKVDNVGGIRRTQPQGKGFFARGIAAAVSHPLCAGNALYRVGVDSPRMVDTVWGGCYRRDLFERIGGFNEAMVRAQDREFNQRIRDSGGQILLTPDIECTYYSRSDLRGFCRWVYQGGFWPFYGSFAAKRRLYSIRNFAPLLFVLGLMLAFSLGFFVPWGIFLFLLLVGWYGLVLFAWAIPYAVRNRDPSLMLSLPMAILLWHSFYGVASIVALVRIVWEHLISGSDGA